MSRRDWIFLALLLVTAACFSPRASAAVSGPTVVTEFGPAVQYGTGSSAKLIYGGSRAFEHEALARTYGMQAGVVTVGDSVGVRAAGQQLAVTAARTLTAGAIAAGAARIASTPVGGGLLATCLLACPALVDALTTARVRGTPAGGLEVNVGGTTSAGSAWQKGTTYYATPEVYCALWIAGFNQPGATCGNFTYTSNGNQANFEALTATGVRFNSSFVVRVARSSCFGENGVDSGIRDLGGICPQGTWNAIDLPTATTKLANAIAGASNKTDIARDVVKNGGQPEAGSISTTGPASSAPRTITSNGPSGATTTSIVNNYHYDGDSITWNETTTVNAPGGDTTTVNDTPPDERSPCDKDPDTVGCMKPGQLPTDAPKWEQKNVDFQVDALGLPSGCPAPRVMNWNGVALALNYQPACDVSPAVRAALIIVTAISCTMIVLQVIRS